MLSDRDVDELIKPFTDRQQKLEDYVVKVIADRVNEIGTMLPSDLHKLERLYKSGSDVRSINEAIAVATSMQVKQIKKLIKAVAADAYFSVKPYYDYRRKAFIPLEENTPLMRVVNAISRQTQNTYKNISNSKVVGFVIRDKKRPTKTKFYNATETYQTVIDEAIQAVQSGVVDFNSAMRKTMKQLGESGMKAAAWESGYTQRMDTVVKRNILNGIQQVNQEVATITGEQFGADGVELTAHQFPAQDHAPFQGHIFTNEEYAKLQNHEAFQDIKGNKYPAQERIIGQFNCRHFAYPLVVETAKPTFTDEQLQDILDQNEKGVTLSNGKHLTGYEVTQKQNELALKVRQYKDMQMLAQESGDEVLAKQCQVKVNQATKVYNMFNRQVASQLDLSARKDKLRVTGYRRISTK